MKRVIQQYSLSKNSYFQQVSTAGGTSVNQIVVANREITKSGYVYIYVSNESKDFKVYFDNLKVTHTRGPLISEEGYYPFGMTMSAISSTAGTVAKNNYKFNAGTELTETFDINYYETYFRQYDAQLGRFTGVDLLTELSFDLTPYHFGANDPTYWNDPSGALALPEVTVYSSVGSLNTIGWSSFLDQIARASFDGQQSFEVDQSQGRVHGGSGDTPKKTKKSRNPKQDKPLTPGEIKQLKESGWDHSDKGKRGGKTDLYKDRNGNIYQKPKGGDSEGEPIGINIKDLGNQAVGVAVGVGTAIILYEIGKWAVAILLAPETGGVSLGAAAAMP